MFCQRAIRRLLIALIALWSGSVGASFLVDPTGGTTLFNDKVGADDDVKTGRLLGIPFSYFGGDPVLTIDVGTNGNLNFSGNDSYSNETVTTTIARISPLWDDLEVVVGSGDFVSEKRSIGKYYAVTWRAHERNRPGTRHAFQAILFGATMRVNGYDFLPDDIVFCHEEIGPTFSKDKATVGLDPGDDGTVVTVPGATALNGLLPHDEAGLLPVGAGGFLLFRADGAGSYTVTVVGNRAPRPRKDTFYTKVRTPFPIDVLTNDGDPDGDPLELVSVTPGILGTTSIGPNGTVLYTPSPAFFGRDTFTYTVRDPSGLTGTATVIIRPFSLGRGTFEGFLRDAPTEDDPAPEPTSAGAGYFKVSLRTDGGFTGLVIYGGWRKNFSGRFDPWGNFTLQYERVVDEETQTVTLKLHLDLLNEMQPLTGSITDGTNTSLITAARPVLRTLASPAPQAGAYKFLILPDESSGPTGIGFGSLRVTTAGLVAVAGKLGDGRNLSSGGSVKPDGTFTFYVNIPTPRGTRAGALWGAVKFDADDLTSDCAGALHWSMPTVGESDEFDAAPSFVGNRHQHVPGERVLALPDGPANAAIDVGGQFQEVLTIDPTNRVTVEAGGDEKLALAIVPSAASFRGSFVEESFDRPNVFKTRALNGVFLKKRNLGGGQYRDADGNIAPVLIQPAQPE